MPDTIRTRLMRGFFCISAPSALALGMLLLLWTGPFLRWLGIPDTGLVPGILYGGVLVGVSAVSLAGIRQPWRHASLVLFIGIYKAAAAVALGWACWHSAVSGFAAPVIAGLYGMLAFVCLLLYPWQALAQESGHG